jgi:quercetin dioxygenase-like cupin family protein
MASLKHFPAPIAALPVFNGPFDARQIESAKANVYFASYPAGMVIPPHRHETDNHGVITAGELILTIGGNEMRYGPGDWYCVPANEEHAARFEVDTAEIEVWFKKD